MVFFAALPSFWPEARLPSASLRLHLTHLLQALLQAERMLRTIHTFPTEKLDERIFMLDDFLVNGLLEHLHSEEHVLFPIVAAYRDGDIPLTAVFCQETREVEELVEEFHRITTEAFDLAELQRVGLAATHLARAHLDEEEAILLPFLDARMTPNEFEREVAHPMISHGYIDIPSEHHASSHYMQKYHHPPKS